MLIAYVNALMKSSLGTYSNYLSLASLTSNKPIDHVYCIQEKKGVTLSTGESKKKHIEYTERHDKVVSQRDCAQPYVARPAKETLEFFLWDLLPQPSYLPDVAPSDYHFFRSMQTTLSEVIRNSKIGLMIGYFKTANFLSSRNSGQMSDCYNF
ncbi:hypothetical protein AVEN_130584-1 [Araneus ventricosus]|uniref:Uncharacterized protein n=1 Tax=Araneus ventricosus TaxID=182803 RepID=A0A4Y2HIL4_ARAVE|nr:hypothetical protein AVEN_130584-1 [Araneus ventricosus]